MLSAKPTPATVRSPSRSTETGRARAGAYIATRCQATTPTVAVKPMPQPASPTGAKAIAAIMANHAAADDGEPTGAQADRLDRIGGLETDEVGVAADGNTIAG